MIILFGEMEGAPHWLMGPTRGAPEERRDFVDGIEMYYEVIFHCGRRRTEPGVGLEMCMWD